MPLSDLLDERSVVVNLRVASKRQALEILAERAAAITGVDERAIFEVLIERERLGTTGVGRGIAIPHGKVAGLDTLFGMLVKLEAPIEFDAVDDEPVDLIFLLLAPETAGAEHLKALARVSRLLRDRSFCERLRASEDPHAILSLLGESATSNAA